MNQDLKKCVNYVGGEPVVTFEKGDVTGHEFHGNQHTGGGAPAFVSTFIGEHKNIGNMKAALKARSTEKLNIALRLLAGHEDTASNTIRSMINDELKSR